MSLEERLDKIRSQPKLQNQKHSAIILGAVDETLRSQNAEPSPTAYFAALLSLIGQYLSPEKGIVNQELGLSVVYLLDLVTPHVPTPLLRSKFSQIFTSVAPALTHQNADAPLIRASLGCLESLLKVQDAQAWSLPSSSASPRRAVAGILGFALDPRPKVRKRAHDAITNVLKSPPPSPSLDHPCADMCAETALRTLQEEAQKAGKTKGSKRQKESQHEPQLIHALQLVKTVSTAANGWPSSKIDALCELLLDISKSSHEYLVMAAFEIFEVIFASLADEVSSAKLPRLLGAIQELQPSKDDSQLLPPWIAVLSRGYDVASQVEPEETFDKLPDLFTSISTFLSSPSHNIRISASECLVSLLHTCIPSSTICEPSIMDQKAFERLGKIVSDLLSIKYQSAWMEVFNVVGAAFEALKWRADPALRTALKTIGDLRSDDAFAGNNEADAVISKAITAIGPDRVLDVLPLNLLKPQPGQVGRAWMLPLIRDSVRNTRLAHFREELVPLSETMFQRVLDHGKADKTMEIKIYETIVSQIWATLPGYCELPMDLTTAFDQTFAEMLANLLYQQTQMRTDLCRALQNLVESNQAVLALGEDADPTLLARVSKQDAQKNIEHLAGFAGNLLAMLFNVYGETLPQYRGFILQCINAYLSITPQPEINATFERVATMLESSLGEAGPQTQADKQKQNNGSGNKMPPTSHTLMDLINTISIYLPRETFAPLFNLAASVINRSDDPQLQKKAYKLIPRLGESENTAAVLLERNQDLQAVLINAAEKATAPARRDRLAAIAQIVPSLPSDDLHFIPSVLSEVVISCKEVNEKARTAAFDLLVLLGEKMSEGGTVVNAKVSHMPSDAPSVTASLEEYLTMVSAGLAGSTPHMISASITALARLLYEFRTRLSEPAIVDLVQTIDLFLTSANREIVRSCLGFVKVCVLSLPTSLMEPRLASLVPNLCVWSHEHKAHFKSKVKHIFERMIKRFGVDLIARYTPAEDQKLIANIRKSRDRAKRKKDAAADGDEDEDAAPSKPVRKGNFESEYDQAVYGSDDESAGSSDEDISDDEVLGKAIAKGKQAKNKKVRTGHGEQYIVEDEDEPLDLLSRNALAHVSSTRPVKGRKDAEMNKRRKAKTDIDGKLIFNDDDGAADADGGAMDLDGDPGDGTLQGGINAYVDAIKSKDAATRGQRGKLKFKQKGFKGSVGDDEDDDGGVDVDAKELGKARRDAGRGGRGGRRGFRGGSRGGAAAGGRRPLGAERSRGPQGDRVSKTGGPQRGGRGKAMVRGRVGPKGVFKQKRR